MLKFFVFSLLICCLIIPAKSEEVYVKPVPKPLRENPRLFPINIASDAMGSNIEYIPGKTAMVPLNANFNSIIDADRSSGIILNEKGDHTFMLSFKKIPFINKITITGAHFPAGATVTVKTTPLPAEYNDGQWKTAVSDHPLESPVTLLTFSPKSAIQVLITFHFPSSFSDCSLNDISVFSTKDARNYKIKETGAISASSKPQTQNKFNLGSIYSGAQVTHVSSNFADPELANYLNDDNPSTYMELNPNDKESVVIMDLGEERKVGKISMTHSQQKGKLVMYVARDLPDSLKKPPPNLPIPSVREKTQDIVGDLLPFRENKNGKSKTQPSASLEKLETATLQEVDNIVTISKKNSPRTSANPGDSIQGTDILRTGSKSRAELEFNDRSLVRFGSNTTFSFEPGSRDMEVKAGEALIHVPPGKGGARIKTPTATAAIFGDTLMVNVLESGACQFVALSRDANGPISIQLNNDPSKSLRLEAGNMLVLPPNAKELKNPQPINIRDFTKTNRLFSDSPRPLPQTALQEIQEAMKPPLPPGVVVVDNPPRPKINNLTGEQFEDIKIFLDGIPVYATMDVGGNSFSSLESGETQGRYIILKFVQDAPSAGSPSLEGGLKVMDFCVFGDYEINELALEEKLPSERLDYALITATENAPDAAESERAGSQSAELDIHKVGEVEEEIVHASSEGTDDNSPP